MPKTCNGSRGDKTSNLEALYQYTVVVLAKMFFVQHFLLIPHRVRLNQKGDSFYGMVQDGQHTKLRYLLDKIIWQKAN